MQTRWGCFIFYSSPGVVALIQRRLMDFPRWGKWRARCAPRPADDALVVSNRAREITRRRMVHREMFAARARQTTAGAAVLPVSDLWSAPLSCAMQPFHAQQFFRVFNTVAQLQLPVRTGWNVPSHGAHLPSATFVSVTLIVRNPHAV